MTKKGDTCYYVSKNIATYSFQQLHIDCMVFAPQSKAGCLNLREKPSLNDGHGGHWLRNIEQDLSHICVRLCSVTKQTACQELQSEMLQYRELIKHGSVSPGATRGNSSRLQLCEPRGEAALAGGVLWCLRVHLNGSAQTRRDLEKPL